MVESNESDLNQQPPAAPTDDLGLQQFEAVADEQGISLDELSQAYAELIRKGDDPYEPPQQSTSDGGRGRFGSGRANGRG